MRTISMKQLAVWTLLVGALVFASGTALAQDHGDDGHGTDTHSQPNTTHDEPEHATDTHGETAHGEDAHGEAAHGEDHGEGHSSIPHLQNLVTGWIAPYLPDAIAHNLKAFIDPIYSLFVAFLLALFFIGLSRQLDARKPGRRQMAAEMIFGGLYSLFQAIIGPSARRYTPYLGTLFIFILCNNLAGLFPLGHAATSSFNSTTFALGAMTFLYVQGIALKENGILGYLHHMAGSPKTAMDWGFSLLLFPLHLLGELIKPISLALRLFGNIFGEDTLVATMVILGYLSVKALGGIFLPDNSAVFGFLPGIPLQLPFYFLGLLSSTIQALVFTLLATVYIALWLPHGDHDHAEAHGH
jgi:F-type H+-transporting ATPase subunit a